MREHIHHRMWLIPADSQLDRHVSNIPLHKARQRSHFCQRRGGLSRQRRHFLPHLRRRVSPAPRQIHVPQPHAAPPYKRFPPPPSRRHKRHDPCPLHAPVRLHGHH